MTIQAFFDYAREREFIRRRRAMGHAYPWTQDEILGHYRFCNIFREHDATTLWFKENVRDPLKRDPDVLLATVLFRWFNRISTGNAIFVKGGIHGTGQQLDIASIWDCRTEVRVHEWIDGLRNTILHHCGKGPYVTGSYIVQGKQGMNKLEGVLNVFYQLTLRDDPSPREMAEICLKRRNTRKPVSLEEMHTWLIRSPYMGAFMAYEVVTDLRHTKLLDKAPDVYQWANPGPGARRGLNRLYGRPLEQRVPMDQLLKEMRLIRYESDEKSNWPQSWGTWELREVEHTLCEFDKYVRAQLGQGRPRGVYRPTK